MTYEKRMDTALDILNRIFAEAYGRQAPTRQKTNYFYYDPPKDWEGTLYRFAYTPWKTEDFRSAKTGFWTLKYKYLKTKKRWKLVKKTRFGRRKIAHKRALEWYKKYYGGNP